MTRDPLGLARLRGQVSSVLGDLVAGDVVLGAFVVVLAPDSALFAVDFFLVERRAGRARGFAGALPPLPSTSWQDWVGGPVLLGLRAAIAPAGRAAKASVAIANSANLLMRGLRSLGNTASAQKTPRRGDPSQGAFDNARSGAPKGPRPPLQRARPPRRVPQRLVGNDDFFASRAGAFGYRTVVSVVLAGIRVLAITEAGFHLTVKAASFRS
jgi:hypothetical protein